MHFLHLIWMEQLDSLLTLNKTFAQNPHRTVVILTGAGRRSIAGSILVRLFVVGKIPTGIEIILVFRGGLELAGLAPQ